MEFNEQQYLDWYQGFNKPWSQEILTRFYIMYPGKTPNYSRLSAYSGVNPRIIRDWVRELDLESQRKTYVQTLEREIISKTHEKTVELVSDELAEINSSHYLSYHQIREFVDLKLQLQLEELKELTEQYKKGKLAKSKLLRAYQKIRASDLNFLSLAQDRSVQGERSVKGMNYLFDLDAAYKALQEDYVILPKDEYQQMLEG